jgi:hypothetical protein
MSNNVRKNADVCVVADQVFQHITSLLETLDTWLPIGIHPASLWQALPGQHRIPCAEII